jgi:hypothetical protein
MSHCNLGSTPDILSVILQSNVRNISLGHNNIDSLGAIQIAQYLEGNPPIEGIYLDNNSLNDNDAILLSSALKRNTNLNRLHLERNNFTSTGVKALMTCVCDVSSLNAISESNHTLSMYMFKNANYFQGGQDYDDNCRIGQCIRMNQVTLLSRIQKLFIVLEDKEALLKYLADVPVELMPEVLEFFHGRTGNYHSLNRIYATMRWWNMPALFSYHRRAKSDTKRKRDD